MTWGTKHAVELAGADLEAAREVAAWEALHPAVSAGEVMDVELRELLHFAKVAHLMAVLGERPGEPAWPGEEPRSVDLSPPDSNLLAVLAESMAGCCTDAITSGLPEGPPVSPAHAEYYGAKVRMAERVLAALGEEQGR